MISSRKFFYDTIPKSWLDLVFEQWPYKSYKVPDHLLSLKLLIYSNLGYIQKLSKIIRKVNSQILNAYKDDNKWTDFSLMGLHGQALRNTIHSQCAKISKNSAKKW